MRGAVAALSLAWALALGLVHSHPGKPGGAGAWFHDGAEAQLNDTEVASRCADEGGFDAVTLDEHGVMLFFRAQLINASWPEIQGPVDAALRIHHKESPGLHDSVYLFQGERVWAYAGGRLRPGYPRLIGEEFKGVPGDLDSAMECHPEDCTAESLLFFKGSDSEQRVLARLGGQYFRLDSKRDGWHSWPLNHTWQELSGQVDNAFSWDKKLYLIQGSQVYIYRVGPGYTLVQGYPRGLQEELGIAGADATFSCPHSAELFVIQGKSLERVDLNLSPRSPRPEGPIPHDHVDSAMCNADGVHLFHGNTVHHYASVAELTTSPKPSPPQNVTAVLFGCPH
ncbi:serine/threonine protein kinase [Platysternon megacephalum]|uniref:Serine/threonine protein kinase n=1 Tax=Platysternon megacephalum TaxID=55544 RepID=A0A4D9DKW6_9SAUR|nr:serine/threonine protein kinase [Platysternon megacephalum]